MRTCQYCSYTPPYCTCYSRNTNHYCTSNYYYYGSTRCSSNNCCHDYSHCPRPCPRPCPPAPVPKREDRGTVCNETCGNLLLNDSNPELTIWTERISEDATVTVSVFNSSFSTDSIEVSVIRNEGNPVEFTVPRGNTLSATVEDVDRIEVARDGTGQAEGKYCLEVCYPERRCRRDSY